MRYFTLAVLMAFVLAALMFTWAGLQQAPAPAVAKPAEEPPRYVLSGAQWTRLDRQGQPEFHAVAATVEYYADDSIRLHDVAVDALGGLRSPWHLKASAGVAPPHEHRLRLDGPVVADGKTADGEAFTINTDNLWIDQLRRELYTGAPVRMDSGLRSATAVGMRADFAGEHLKLLNDVHFNYAPPDR
jgi:LPS export ABC transporter protein LptC